MNNWDVNRILNRQTKEDTKYFIEKSEELGKLLSPPRKDNPVGIDMKTSQIRNIFDSIKKLQNIETDYGELQLLRPRLAYLSGRNPKWRSLRPILDKMILNIENNQQLRNFQDFFEAIIAYHKAYGGKD